MINELKYNGHTANPSDYECNDGDLAVSIGIVPEDGTLKPILPPSEVMELDLGDLVKYIHETSNFKHYILLNRSGKLSWKDENDSDEKTLRLFTSETDVYQVTGIGNTLVVLSSNGMHYFLWKEDNYLYLGTHIPECPITFGLQAEMIRGGRFSINFDDIYINNIFDEFSDSNKKKITDQVLAKVNKFIKENSTDKGKFIYPFLLRYAYRLYDGSLTMHSSPILMIASSDITPQVFYESINGKDDYYNGADLRVTAAFHTIDYQVLNDANLQDLEQWGDIVKSVDIFVSSPIYTYDQNGQCTAFKKEYEDDGSYSVCKHINQAASMETYPLRYQLNSFAKLYAFTFDPERLTKPKGKLLLPAKSKDEIKAEIKACSQFYMLQSIKLEDLKAQPEREVLHVEENYLQSLVTREVMTDDYDSHDTLIVQYAFPYNSRLNIANMKKVLFIGHNAACLFTYSDGYVNHFTSGEPTDKDFTYPTRVYVYIKQDGKDIIVEGGTAPVGNMAPLLFFYYPNINAYKAVIKQDGKDPYVMNLEKHDFLNGAFYFNGWSNPSQDTEIFLPDNPDSNVENRTIQQENKIYTSEVNNPFFFPLSGINSVGTGTIIGISSAAKALSEGQFGQFPLYAFTSDGVWALEVSATGSYSAKQPITRDICINTDSITQIDSAVLFATNRGIMLISGSQTQCITDTINAPEPFSIGSLPMYEELASVFNSKAHDYEKLYVEDITMIPFIDFLESCRMIYDYTHQRIIVYNPVVRYAYVYSLKSHLWGMMLSDINGNVNSYPEALAMSTKKKDTLIIPVLVDFTQPSADSATGLIITRPFKMNEPNIFKTIDTIIQRGLFKRENIQQVLYGSNDLYHWHVVWSSKDMFLRGFRGTPYKAFRLALVCRLNKEENIFGCSIQFNPRRLNQPR